MTTRERISNLSARIEELEDTLTTYRYAIEVDADSVDPETIIDMQMELAELEEQLNFAWQDDEEDYNYAVEMQMFNPDGSLMYY